MSARMMMKRWNTHHLLPKSPEEDLKIRYVNLRRKPLSVITIILQDPDGDDDDDDDDLLASFLPFRVSIMHQEFRKQVNIWCEGSKGRHYYFRGLHVLHKKEREETRKSSSLELVLYAIRRGMNPNDEF